MVQKARQKALLHLGGAFCTLACATPAHVHSRDIFSFFVLCHGTKVGKRPFCTLRCIFWYAMGNSLPTCILGSLFSVSEPAAQSSPSIQIMPDTCVCVCVCVCVCACVCVCIYISVSEPAAASWPWIQIMPEARFSHCYWACFSSVSAVWNALADSNHACSA
jgi:hypothetical protein